MKDLSMDRWAVVAVLGIVLAAPGGATVRTARADALGKGGPEKRTCAHTARAAVALAAQV